MIPYSKIVGLPVFAVKNQVLIGHIFTIVMKKTELSPHGFVVKTSNLPFSKPRIVAVSDILELSNEGLVVESANDVSDLTDAIRIKEALEAGFAGIGQKVITESGKRLGKVFDYLISTPDMNISKIYVKGIFSERIFPLVAVKGFKKGLIIVRDDFDLAPLGKSAFAAETA